MLLVRTSVADSPIHGLGLFAAEPIRAGTTIWALDQLLDRVFPAQALDAYPEHIREYLEHYCEYFPETEELVLSGDGDRFTNHSDDPNTAVVGRNAPDARVVAVRDIAEGEEITCSYAVIRSLKWGETEVAVA